MLLLTLKLLIVKINYKEIGKKILQIVVLLFYGVRLGLYSIPSPLPMSLVFSLINTSNITRLFGLISHTK